MDETQSERILALAAKTGLLRAHDLVEQGIAYTALSRLTQQGRLQRISRGLYALPDRPVTEYQSLVEASACVPAGVICLLSALRFHQLTTYAPFEIWMAIENKQWKPRAKGLPLRIFYFSGAAFISGVETHILEGVALKIYDPAKTVADCFKYRNKIGIDLCIEALRTGLRQRKFTVDQLSSYAKICRIQNIIQPYLEAML
ncbi:MAG: transcriptional regulator [Caldilinea sp. CFX5]|nr:transcriptional regulator [Caldilinea sp. CFX5]